jgi:hypothetical protein
MRRSIRILSGVATDALSLRHITGYTTKDKQNGTIREYLAERADFLGAIRLPSDAFKREGTAVVTDIVFLRKRAPREEARHADPEWLSAATLAIEGAEVAENKYFVNHPEMVLGTWSRRDTLYGEGYSVESSGDLAEQLREAVGRLAGLAPAVVTQPSTPDTNGHIRQPFTPPLPLTHIAEGSFFIRDDRAICQVQDDQAVPVVYGGTPLTAYGTMTGKWLAALIGLHDRPRRVLQLQNEG